MKKSFTGYLNIERENARFENNMFSVLGSAYYSPSSGFNWDELRLQIKSDSIDLSPKTLNNWVVSQAASHGIIILNSEISQDGVKSKIKYLIAGSSMEGSTFGDLINVVG
ncbi:hypothetical protein [Aliivibrio fischeri]|uniref:Uncharacterized protein n=1 Tax=Aliivibrio fischeri SR5 TaxID=1088719 RepID=A0AAV3EW47_ALIFS|nr:hypothetical protein [Aliivibrio fischeri]EHN70914.1 hypothetical protein VFSR5_0694 [Aliivibrio fischeri SR5]